jgi:imidazolonepropionase-like amidohydrolase
MKVRIHCHRADDIATALRLVEEFGLKYSLEHVTDGIRIKEVLGARKATCVVGPLLLEPNKQETGNICLETAGELEKAGCKICLMADNASRTAWLPVEVGMLLRRGLSEETAFRALTINAAENLELDHRIGSLEPGKDADIAVFDGHPFCNMSLCRLTMIEGVVYHNTL